MSVPPSGLLDETALFLHRSEATLPDEKRKLLEKIHRSSPIIAGKKVLIVDDDMRNIFALTSALERHQMHMLHAKSGPQAIALLRETPDVDAVLMDIMMPEMDGFEVDPQDPGRPAVRGAAHHRRDREGDESRSRPMPRSWSFRLHQQARRRQPPRVAVAGVVEPVVIHQFRRQRPRCTILMPSGGIGRYDASPRTWHRR